jgi:hypothetical protein
MSSRPHTIYIDDDLWEAAAERAKTEGISTARVINTSVSTYLHISIGTQMDPVDASAPSHRTVSTEAEIRSGGDEPF